MGLLGVIAFVVALLFSIMVHEAGHYLTAKRYGMKVTEFFLGFGRRLWSTTRGETEFGIKAIPAGGYCRIIGMSTREELSAEDAPRAFVQASAPKRLVVLGAGSFLHFVLGFLILFIIYAAVGTSVSIPVVSEVLPCVTTADTCATSDPISPAKSAGLKPGDRFVSINGVAVTDWSKSVTQIRNSPGEPIDLVVDRSGKEISLTITPDSITRDGKKVGVIGVINIIADRVQNPIKAVASSAKLGKEIFTGSVSSLFSLPAKVPELVRQTFGNQPRDASGLVGVVGVARVSAQTASDAALSIRERLATFLMIIASLNIFVGIFNLIPILPLDGGHMALAVGDGIRRSRARRRGLNLPEPIDVERLTPVTIVVFVLLAALSLLLLGADIFNPIHLNS